MEKRVVQVWDFPNVNTHQYDQVIAEMEAIGQRNPKGRLHHVAATKPDGNLIVINIWESKEAFEEFRNVLLPVIAKYDIPQIQPVVYQVHNIIVAEKIKEPVA